MLEKERLDTSYLDHGRQARQNSIDVQARAQLISEEMVKARVDVVMSRERKRFDSRLQNTRKLYFHAGRYAAGVRDESATKAHAVVLEQEDKA